MPTPTTPMPQPRLAAIMTSLMVVLFIHGKITHPTKLPLLLRTSRAQYADIKKQGFQLLLLKMTQKPMWLRSVRK